LDDARLLISLNAISKLKHTEVIITPFANGAVFYVIARGADGKRICSIK